MKVTSRKRGVFWGGNWLDTILFQLYSNTVEKEEIAIWKHMSNTLDKVYETISKPQSKVVQIFNIGATVVGVLGILAIVDIIASWISG